MDAVLNLRALSDKKDLKLSVLDPEPNQEGGSLSLPGGQGVSASYHVFVQPCVNVTCPCHDVLFRCQAISTENQTTAPKELQEFWLDVQAQKIVMTAELEKKPESMRLAEDVAAALTPEDWKRLYRWLCVSKLELIEQATAADVQLSQLPDSANGRMVPFIEIFPFGLALYFTLQDEYWAADEMYCVHPDCDCKETMLSFFKLRDSSGVITKSISDPAGIRYNYRTGLGREAFRGPAGNPPHADLLAALQTANPLLNLILERRHLLMQSIYLRHHVELLSQACCATAAAIRKVGRNDRCPCGSGKKFKHCCLGKF
jgi:hypothetical protein